MALSMHLQAHAQTVTGRARLGVEAVAHALLVVPKTLARNSGLDPTDAVSTTTLYIVVF